MLSVGVVVSICGSSVIFLIVFLYAIATPWPMMFGGKDSVYSVMRLGFFCFD